ncbi:hypothetical protein N665_0015s0080 [Sinapis alba]|nr:hypothetical protein N665_0015s0080 [Sinapis alba]
MAAKIRKGSLAPWILWQLWISRNKLIFEDMRCSAADVISMATASAREWIQNQEKTPLPPRRTPPPSHRPTSHVRSPLMGDRLAMHEAILKCGGLGLSRARCESESASLIKILKDETSCEELYGIVSDISLLASSFNCISFLWIPQ